MNRPIQLRAGAAKADISPAKGIQIAGDIGRCRPCTGVQEPIFARALVFEQADELSGVVSVAVLAIEAGWVAEIRRRAQAAYGIPAARLMVHATQNHASPSIGDHFCRPECSLVPAQQPWLRGGDPRYNEPAVAGVLDAIGRAAGRLTPVKVAAGRAIDGRVAFNRRHIMRDGSRVCQPSLCDPEILQVEGPADPEVGVVTFTARDGRVVSALLHHTCHPCHGFWEHEAHPGWPGAWCREMEAHFGASCTPLVLNGCCGNIIHFNYLNPDQERIGGSHLEMGRLLAESTRRALQDMRPMAPAPLAWASRRVPVPWRKLAAGDLAKAKAILGQHDGPAWTKRRGSTTAIRKGGARKKASHMVELDPSVVMVEWDWVFAVGVMDLADESRTVPAYPYEIQAVRIGDMALLALMGEPFVEAQLRIKREAPFAFLQVAHMGNGNSGYIPTREALAGGGYETRVGRGSQLAPEALELIERAAVRMLKQLARRP